MGHKPFVQDKGPSHRPARYAHRIKEELSQLIPGELKDPRVEDIGFITITSVSVTPDLKNASVMFSLMSEEDRSKAKVVETVLNNAAPFLRRELIERMRSKVAPLLSFKFDRGFENTGRIDNLLKNAQSEPGSDGEE